MDGCVKSRSPSRLPCSTIRVPSVLNNGSCTTRAGLGGLAGGGWEGMLPHLGGSELRMWSQFVFKALTRLLSVCLPVCGLLSSLGCCALTFSPLSIPLRKGLERHSP